MYRTDALQRLATRICVGEEIETDVEVSLLFCDDVFMQQLNSEYRNINKTTDVLSFEQETIGDVDPRPLGDIIISLETVESNCHGNRQWMREEVYLLFCHGLLHLLGYDHATKRERDTMTERQSRYLGISKQAAWQFGPKSLANRATETT